MALTTLPCATALAYDPSRYCNVSMLSYSIVFPVAFHTGKFALLSVVTCPLLLINAECDTHVPI
jgi:hypothetical protein